MLKPNRWMTVEFHNSKNSVWNAIQESLLRAGFIIADVRTLDKKQGSFKQVTTTSAVKQDLVISCYKPKDSFRREFLSHAGSEDTAWAFVRQHLANIPVVVVKNDRIEVVAERQLISAGFAERKGKKLIPTKDGYNLVAILPDSLTSPQLTAEWETRLTGIAKGSDSPADFMRGIEEMTAGLVKTYSAISEDKAKLFTPQREAIGTCPRCGAAVYEGKKNFYCSDRACSFVMWKNDRFFEQRKKAFTKAIAAALLKDGKVKIKGMYSTKTGKTFDGVVLLADTGGKYVNFRVEQNRK